MYCRQIMFVFLFVSLWGLWKLTLQFGFISSYISINLCNFSSRLSKYQAWIGTFDLFTLPRTKDYGGLGAASCVDIMPAPKDAQLKVEVSPGIAALHLNSPQTGCKHKIFVCMWSNRCHTVRAENMMTSHGVKGRKRGEIKMSTLESGCRERSSNVRRVLLLPRVSYSWYTNVFVTTFFSSEIAFKAPSHWHFALPLFLSSTPSFCPPPSTPPPSPPPRH